MSSNAPAVREMPDQSAQAVQSLTLMTNDQLRYISNTEVVPKHLRGRPEAMLAVVLKGRSLGFDDIQALDAINFIDGKATLSGEAMAALVRRAGHSLKIDATAESATVTGTRKDNGDTTTVTWTTGMAKDAGLAGKDNWKRYPQTMLTWRAISQVCRFLFPDVLKGVSYTEDEAIEAAERGAVTAAVRDLPPVEEAQIRDEPVSVPSDAQLNRIAALEQRTGDGYRTVLRGVFGVEMANELTAEAANQYEAMLTQSLPPENSPEGPQEAVSPVSDEVAAEEPAAATADDEPTAPSGEPEPEPPAEEVEGEVVEDEPVSPDLLAAAAETIIPIGDNRGKALKDIHDGWLTWALRNTGRLPDPFVEALELYVRETKPEIWAAERS